MPSHRTAYSDHITTGTVKITLMSWLIFGRKVGRLRVSYRHRVNFMLVVATKLIVSPRLIAPDRARIQRSRRTTG